MPLFGNAAPTCVPAAQHVLHACSPYETSTSNLTTLLYRSRNRFDKTLLPQVHGQAQTTSQALKRALTAQNSDLQERATAGLGIV